MGQILVLLVHIVALEILAEPVVLNHLAAGVVLGLPVGTRIKMPTSQAEMAETEFSLTFPALPHFTAAAAVGLAMYIKRDLVDGVEAVTGTVATHQPWDPKSTHNQARQTQAAVVEEAMNYTEMTMAGQVGPASSSYATCPPPAVSHLRRRRRHLPLRIKRSRLRRPATPSSTTSPTRG